MTRSLLILLVAFISFSAAPAKELLPTTARPYLATCTGSRDCHACKNCKYCKHCKKEGGTCGVCK